jgi:hypothetical protein
MLKERATSDSEWSVRENARTILITTAEHACPVLAFCKRVG